MATFDVGFRLTKGGSSAPMESRVEASDSAEAEHKVKDKYNQPIEIIYVKKR